MRDEWLKHCLSVSREKADLYSGCRKILRGRMISFYNMDNSLNLEDAGYTTNKMRSLERGYLHPESKNVAVDLWERRRAQDKYGSVGVTTYNHFIKNDPNKKSKRASVMGPCIQSLVLTYLDKKTYSVDVFYRTTELFKKFPADLVFIRDVLLSGFNLGGMRFEEMNCHFANITAHPMYAVTWMPFPDDPIKELERIKKVDKYFHEWIVKWTARYICPEHHRGIQKFAQAMRVHADAMKRLDKRKLVLLRSYFSDNHPGYRNTYVAPEEEDETV
jgi:hypothetical protein